jgi:large subunit ribosomal protein L29
MKAEDIRALGDDELRARILELEEESFRLRFRSATEALEDPLRQRVIRRDVARLQTIMRERAMGIVRTAAPAAAKKAPARKTAGAKKAPRRSTAR